MTEHINDDALVAQCLLAVADGPFVTDGEFATITGVTLAEVKTLLEAWPRYEAADEPRIATIVAKALDALLTYPNPDREEAWPRFLTVAPARVERLAGRWKKRERRLEVALRKGQKERGGICIGRRGWHSLEIRIRAREFPQLDDFWDGNWLNTSLCLRARYPSVTVEKAWLRANEFERLRHALCAVQAGDSREFDWETLEPWVQLRGQIMDTGALRIDGKLGLTRGRPEFTLWSRPSELTALVDSLDALLEEFPVRRQ